VLRGSLEAERAKLASMGEALAARGGEAGALVQQLQQEAAAKAQALEEEQGRVRILEKEFADREQGLAGELAVYRGRLQEVEREMGRRVRLWRKGHRSWRPRRRPWRTGSATWCASRWPWALGTRPERTRAEKGARGRRGRRGRYLRSVQRQWSTCRRSCRRRRGCWRFKKGRWRSSAQRWRSSRARDRSCAERAGGEQPQGEGAGAGEGDGRRAGGGGELLGNLQRELAERAGMLAERETAVVQLERRVAQLTEALEDEKRKAASALAAATAAAAAAASVSGTRGASVEAEPMQKEVIMEERQGVPRGAPGGPLGAPWLRPTRPPHLSQEPPGRPAHRERPEGSHRGVPADGLPPAPHPGAGPRVCPPSWGWGRWGAPGWVRALPLSRLGLQGGLSGRQGCAALVSALAWLPGEPHAQGLRQHAGETPSPGWKNRLQKSFFQL